MRRALYSSRIGRSHLFDAGTLARGAFGGYPDAMRTPKKPAPSLFTLGHSTRPLAEFTMLLRAHGVGRVADVRTVPRSRHNPQFNKEVLGKSLRARRIGYRHMKELGGLRRARKDSELNAGWRNASFRGYADYMQTPQFDAGLRKLMVLAAKKPTAIVCAEAVPWRCHRSMIADALTARGWTVRHIMSRTSARVHALNPMARKRRGRLIYPSGAPRPASKRKPAAGRAFAAARAGRASSQATER
jgi:hypothetical protein